MKLWANTPGLVLKGLKQSRPGTFRVRPNLAQGAGSAGAVRTYGPRGPRLAWESLSDAYRFATRTRRRRGSRTSRWRLWPRPERARQPSPRAETAQGPGRVVACRRVLVLEIRDHRSHGGRILLQLPQFCGGVAASPELLGFQETLASLPASARDKLGRMR